MSTVKISAAAAVSTLGDSHVLPLGNVGNSEANKVTVATLAQYAAKYASGIQVVWYPSSVSGRPYCADLSYFLSNNYSNIPVGLAIRNGTKTLVVSLTQESMYWGSGVGSGTYVSSRGSTYDLWDGEEKTASIISVENDSSYAPGYCYQFSCSSGTYGLGAGQWWLPSVGELYMILSHYWQINFALSCINALGTTTVTSLSRSYYWSSDEISATYAWNVNFYYGYVGSNFSKASNSYVVRPVSAFQDGTSC